MPSEKTSDSFLRYVFTGSAHILLLTLTLMLGGNWSSCSQLVSSRQNRNCTWMTCSTLAGLRMSLQSACKQTNLNKFTQPTPEPCISTSTHRLLAMSVACCVVRWK